MEIRKSVNHPDHYALHYPLEVKDMIEIILINAYGPDAYKAYCLGNELKYRLRAGFKGDVSEEIGKAMKYMEFREEAADEGRDDLVFDDPETINDGHGNYWDKWCPDCGAEMEIVRPGKVQRSESCDCWQEEADILNDHSERTAVEETLRWRQGGMQPSLVDLVDWNEAPGWAKWAAQQPDGEISWYERIPEMNPAQSWSWIGGSQFYKDAPLAQDWEDPLKRPADHTYTDEEPEHRIQHRDSGVPSDMPYAERLSVRRDGE